MNTPKPTVILSCEELTVQRTTDKKDILREVSLSIPTKGVIALVGQSGSGKSTFLNICLGELPETLQRKQGKLHLHQGKERLDPLTEPDLVRSIIGYVPQHPMRALHPLHRLESIIHEAISLIPELAHDEARSQTALQSALQQAGLEEDFFKNKRTQRPGQLSGGMCQRLLIALALLKDPPLLLLDEPTTALDPLRRKAVLETIQKAADNRAVLMVTHDLRSVAEIATHVYVLQEAQVVEQGPVLDVFQKPRHTHTRDLLRDVPILRRQRHEAA